MKIKIKKQEIMKLLKVVLKEQAPVMPPSAKPAPNDNAQAGRIKTLQAIKKADAVIQGTSFYDKGGKLFSVDLIYGPGWKQNKDINNKVQALILLGKIAADQNKLTDLAQKYPGVLGLQVFLKGKVPKLIKAVIMGKARLKNDLPNFKTWLDSKPGKYTLGLLEKIIGHKLPLKLKELTHIASFLRSITDVSPEQARALDALGVPAPGKAQAPGATATATPGAAAADAETAGKTSAEAVKSEQEEIQSFLSKNGNTLAEIKTKIQCALTKHFFVGQFSFTYDDPAWGKRDWDEDIYAFHFGYVSYGEAEKISWRKGRLKQQTPVSEQIIGGALGPDRKEPEAEVPAPVPAPEAEPTAEPAGLNWDNIATLQATFEELYNTDEAIKGALEGNIKRIAKSGPAPAAEAAGSPGKVNQKHLNLITELLPHPEVIIQKGTSFTAKAAIAALSTGGDMKAKNIKELLNGFACHNNPADYITNVSGATALPTAWKAVNDAAPKAAQAIKDFHKKELPAMEAFNIYYPALKAKYGTGECVKTESFDRRGLKVLLEKTVKLPGDRGDVAPPQQPEEERRGTREGHERSNKLWDMAMIYHQKMIDLYQSLDSVAGQWDENNDRDKWMAFGHGGWLKSAKLSNLDNFWSRYSEAFPSIHEDVGEEKAAADEFIQGWGKKFKDTISNLGAGGTEATAEFEPAIEWDTTEAPWTKPDFNKTNPEAAKKFMLAPDGQIMDKNTPRWSPERRTKYAMERIGRAAWYGYMMTKIARFTALPDEDKKNLYPKVAKRAKTLYDRMEATWGRLTKWINSVIEWNSKEARSARSQHDPSTDEDSGQSNDPASEDFWKQAGNISKKWKGPLAGQRGDYTWSFSAEGISKAKWAEICNRANYEEGAITAAAKGRAKGMHCDLSKVPDGGGVYRFTLSPEKTGQTSATGKDVVQNYWWNGIAIIDNNRKVIKIYKWEKADDMAGFRKGWMWWTLEDKHLKLLSRRKRLAMQHPRSNKDAWQFIESLLTGEIEKKTSAQNVDTVRAFFKKHSMPQKIKFKAGKFQWELTAKGPDRLANHRDVTEPTHDSADQYAVMVYTGVVGEQDIKLVIGSNHRDVVCAAGHKGDTNQDCNAVYLVDGSNVEGLKTRDALFVANDISDVIRLLAPEGWTEDDILNRSTLGRAPQSGEEMYKPSQKELSGLERTTDRGQGAYEKAMKEQGAVFIGLDPVGKASVSADPNVNILPFRMISAGAKISHDRGPLVKAEGPGPAKVGARHVNDMAGDEWIQREEGTPNWGVEWQGPGDAKRWKPQVAAYVTRNVKASAPVITPLQIKGKVTHVARINLNYVGISCPMNRCEGKRVSAAKDTSVGVLQMQKGNSLWSHIELGADNAGIDRRDKTSPPQTDLIIYLSDKVEDPETIQVTTRLDPNWRNGPTLFVELRRVEKGKSTTQVLSPDETARYLKDWGRDIPERGADAAQTPAGEGGDAGEAASASPVAVPEAAPVETSANETKEKIGKIELFIKLFNRIILLKTRYRDSVRPKATKTGEGYVEQFPSEGGKAFKFGPMEFNELAKELGREASEYGPPALDDLGRRSVFLTEAKKNIRQQIASSLQGNIADVLDYHDALVIDNQGKTLSSYYSRLHGWNILDRSENRRAGVCFSELSNATFKSQQEKFQRRMELKKAQRGGGKNVSGLPAGYGKIAALVPTIFDGGEEQNKFMKIFKQKTGPERRAWTKMIRQTSGAQPAEIKSRLQALGFLSEHLEKKAKILKGKKIKVKIKSK